EETEPTARDGGVMPEGRPVLMTVDDDVSVSRAVARDLRRRYGEHYRVVRAEDPQQALDALREVKLRGDPVAAILADYRMPGLDVQVVGHPWSGPSHEVRDFLARNSVPYRWWTVDDAEGRRLLDAAGVDASAIPLVVTPEGTALTAPAMHELAQAVGMSTTPATDF